MDLVESVQEVNDPSLNTMQIISQQSELETTTIIIENTEDSKVVLSAGYEISEGVEENTTSESQQKSSENLSIIMESNNHNSLLTAIDDSDSVNQDVDITKSVTEESAMEVDSSEIVSDSVTSGLVQTEDTGNITSISVCDTIIMPTQGDLKKENPEDLENENPKGDNNIVSDSLDSSTISNEVISTDSDTVELPSFINNMDDSISIPPADSFPPSETPNTEPELSKVVDNTIEIAAKSTEKEDVSVPEIKTIENVEYTVLPPGENSIYQEDGTLVVEYPLVTISADNQVEVQHENVEFVSTSEVTTAVELIKDETEFVAADEVIEENSVETEELEHNMETEEEMQLVEMQIDSPMAPPPANKPEIEKNKETKANLKETKPPGKPKGRKSSGTIPSHILGHNMDKPVQEVPNGKAVLKPRLGVKIPYRTLSSQIVSNTELCQQIVQRARQKQEAQEKVDSSASFAKKLTHRLAQSLSGLNKAKKDDAVTQQQPTPNKEESIISEKQAEKAKSGENSSTIEIEKPKNQIEIQSVEILDINMDINVEKTPDDGVEEGIPQQNIGSNSDLIAILEGDGDEGSPILNVPKPVEPASALDDSSEMREIEKEISLTEQKLPQTPQVKGKKFFKSRESRLSESGVKDAKSVTPNATEKDAKEGATVSGANNSKPKISTPLKSYFKRVEEKAPAKEKDIIDIEPQLKPAMVLKTYTRKRKSNDSHTPEPPKKQQIVAAPVAHAPDPKIDFVTPVPPTVYMTKSSRIIKKKVIWDPDEAMPSVRNQAKILHKIEATSKSTPPKPPKTPVKIADSKKVSTEKEKQAEDPKVEKLAEKKIAKTTIEDKAEKKVIVHDKVIIKKADKVEAVVKKVKSPVPVKSPIVKNTSTAVSPKLSPGQSPKKSFKKKMTEIDRLLMDEGAVNMLYDINNSDEQKRRSSGRAQTATGAAGAAAPSSNDKTQNQLDLINRAMEVKNELTQQGTNSDTSISSSSLSTKSLRKKEATPSSSAPAPGKKDATATISRKMSKDSSKSSIHSPPPSPAPFNADAGCRIIRRHSSSSFSSNDDYASLADSDELYKEKEKPIRRKISDPTFVPGDADASAPVSDKRPMKKKSATASSSSSSPEATPKKKTKKNNNNKEDASLTDDVQEEQSHKPVEITVKSEPGNLTGELKTDPTKPFTVIKMNKHYMINLTYSGSESYLTVQLLKDLTVTLKELGRNKNCNLVSIHSQGSSFCLGLDYKGLVESNEELRKKRATNLSNSVREFLKCLLHFPKVLVAGIKGDCVGLGVTMLPLFDMIIASDSASFRAPYCKLGCVPEAGFLMANPFQSNRGLASELMFTTARMKADEAQKRGFVTKLFWPEKFDAEFRTFLARLSNLSKFGLMATKKQLRMVHCQSTETAINNNCKQMTEVWLKEECQKNFTNYNAQTFDIDHQ